jgi:uncharacterized protein YciI
MASFCVSLVPGPNWDAARDRREQSGWAEHAAFMDRLVDSGFLVLGGPVGEHLDTLHLIEAADESEVRGRLAQDPWARDLMLEVGSIRSWSLWLDSRRNT